MDSGATSRSFPEGIFVIVWMMFLGVSEVQLNTNP